MTARPDDIPPESEMTTVTDMLTTAKASASEVVIRHKKQASFHLYSVLAACLAIVERCELDPADRAELEYAFQRQQNNNRRWIEKGSTVYTLVCRYVFDGSTRTNISRYSTALKRAKELQLNSANVEQWLRKHGGINALLFSRKQLAPHAASKTLRLTKTLQFPRDKPFTITLRWTEYNTFEVIKNP